MEVPLDQLGSGRCRVDNDDLAGWSSEKVAVLSVELACWSRLYQNRTSLSTRDKHLFVRVLPFGASYTVGKEASPFYSESMRFRTCSWYSGYKSHLPTRTFPPNSFNLNPESGVYFVGVMYAGAGSDVGPPSTISLVFSSPRPPMLGFASLGFVRSLNGFQ